MSCSMEYRIGQSWGQFFSTRGKRRGKKKKEGGEKGGERKQGILKDVKKLLTLAPMKYQC